MRRKDLPEVYQDGISVDGWRYWEEVRQLHSYEFLAVKKHANGKRESERRGRQRWRDALSSCMKYEDEWTSWEGSHLWFLSNFVIKGNWLVDRRIRIVTTVMRINVHVLMCGMFFLIPPPNSSKCRGSGQALVLSWWCSEVHPFCTCCWKVSKGLLFTVS